MGMGMGVGKSAVQVGRGWCLLGSGIWDLGTGLGLGIDTTVLNIMVFMFVDLGFAIRD